MSDTAQGPYCIGCSYPLVGLSENRCPECGRKFDPADPKSVRQELFSKFEFWLNPPGRQSKWIPIIFASLGLLSAAIPEHIFWLLMLALVGWLLVLGWWLLRLILWAIGKVMTGFIHHQSRSARTWLLTPIIFAAMITCLVLRLPLYASFFVSLPAMDRITQQVSNAPGTAAGVSWMGVYPVEKIEVIPGGMRFIVKGSGLMDSGGFAYSRKGPPPRIGEDYYRPLWGAWYEWRESW